MGRVLDPGTDFKRRPLAFPAITRIDFLSLIAAIYIML
jgi:hypothetical protein